VVTLKCNKLFIHCIININSQSNTHICFCMHVDITGRINLIKHAFGDFERTRGLFDDENHTLMQT